MSGNGVQAFAKHGSFPLWVRAAAFALVYFICAKGGGFLSEPGGTYVSFWLPAGLYVAALLLTERREWPWLILAAVAANFAFDLLHETKPFVILLFTFANTVQAVLGAWLVQRFVAKHPKLQTLKEFVGLIGLAGVVSTMPGGLIGAWTLTRFGLSDSFLESWKDWWGSCGMAVLVLTPFLLVWFSPPDSPGRRHFDSRPKIIEASILMVGLVSTASYVITMKGGILSPYKAWLIPLLLWSGLRFGIRGASAATLLISITIAYCTTRFLKGLTLAQVSSGEYVFILQTVLAASSLVGAIPAIVLSERDRTLAMLEENQQHLKNLTEAAFEGIAITENGVFIDVNDPMLKMFGCQRNEILGSKVVDIVAPESREIVAEAIRTNRETIYEHRLLRKDGSSFLGEARAKVVRIGNRTLRMTALRDITERKLSEEMNKTQSHVLEMITRGEPLTKTLDTLLRRIESHSPNMLCSILLVEPDGVHIRHSAAPSLPAEYLEAIDDWAVGPCAGSCGTAAYRHEPVFVADIASDPLWDDYRQFALPHGLRACWSKPILDAHRNVLGTFAIYHRVPGLPDGHQTQLIDMATHSAAVCITKHRADQALHESEDRFRTVVESTPDCVVVAVNDRLVYLNPAGLKLIGAKNFDEVAGRNIYDFVAAELHDPLRARRQLVLQGGVPSPLIEVQILRLDGSSVLVESQAVPFVYSGQPAILNLMRDITERKRGEFDRAENVKRERKAREEFTHLLITSQEAERQRIAGELHDSLGQNLSVIKNRAQLAAQQSVPPAAASHLEAIERIVSDSITETRNLAHNLRPLHIEQIGLTDSLCELIREVSQSSSIRFERRVENVDDVFKGAAATNIYRVVQEALNNLIKHSRAQQAVVTLMRDVRSVRLRIADDGVGFDASEVLAQRGLGLTSMTERVRMLGGKLDIHSEAGHGTQLLVDLPITDVDGADSPQT